MRRARLGGSGGERGLGGSRGRSAPACQSAARIDQSENTTICRTESDDLTKPLEYISSENSKMIQYQLVKCSIVSEKESVTVIAELPLASFLQVFKTSTELQITGEINFNKDLYVGLNERHHRTQITVYLRKEKDFDFSLVLIASSLAGILLLALIIAFLFKAGFFKRKYRNMIDEQRSS